MIIERYGYWKEDLLWLGELANSEKALQMALEGIAEVKRGRVEAADPGKVSVAVKEFS